MTTRIRDSLIRQKKALELMTQLLAEEFSHLTKRDPQAVTGVEMSLQELIRQVADERSALKAMIKAGHGALKLLELVKTFEPATRDEMLKLIAGIDALEQAASRQADKNYRLALGLYDQNRALIQFIQNEVAPRKRETYSAKGRYAQESASGTLLRGRL
jgi:hypothetical protein